MDDDYSAIGLGVLGAALALGTGCLIYNSVKTSKKEAQKKTIPCTFSDGISQQEFTLFAEQAGKTIKRIEKIIANGPIVIGIVKSNSGLSTWNFVIDFNDNGHLTGDYCILDQNSDSIIPTIVAQSIQTSIKNATIFPEQKETSFINQPIARYCPQCGQKRKCESARFCTHCGHQFTP